MKPVELRAARMKFIGAVAGGAAVVAMGALGIVGAAAPDANASIQAPPAPMRMGATSTPVVTTEMPGKAAPEVKAPHR
jgi:hypothetical protein